MYSSYTNYFEPDCLSLQEMVECDIREMDFNFNDPLLQGEHILSSQDSHRMLKQDRFREHPTTNPGDLTNLQWLQNVSIPMEKGSKNQENEMMVDPNTAMPVQWTTNSHPMNQISSVTARSVPITSVTSVPQTQPVHTRVFEPKAKLQESKSASKENTKPGDKAYPKPLFSYSCLIAMALKNSESGTLPVSEIYKFMMGKFPYFKTAPDGWKNSVRHNLSLNKAFCKLERPQGASQRKGCLWSLKPEKREQMDKEIRKWKKKHSEAIRASMAHPEDLNISSDDLDDSPPQHLFVHTTELVEDKAAADAAKELFGNNLIQEIQNEDLDWDEIMASSTDLQLNPTLTTTMTTTTMPIHNGTTTTTVEIDNAAHYYSNGERHEYDTTSPYVAHYYSLQQQHLSVPGF